MEVATKIVSRSWGRNRESRTGVASVAANTSRECESRNGVANVGHECESQNGVANVGRECESRKEKIGGICKWDPKGSN